MKRTLEHAQRGTDIHEHLETLYRLVVELNAKLVFELGVRSGESTVPLLEGVHATGGKLISVDNCECEAAKQMLSSYGLTDRWTFVLGNDLEFGIKWPRNELADLIFVDTSHEYRQTQMEINVFDPLLRPGGIMAFHDTMSHVAGVYKPILEYLGAHPTYTFEHHQNNNGLGIVRKR